MLQVIKSLRELNFGQLMDVYIESNQENGDQFYPQLPPVEQIIQAEQDFYAYLQLFFQEKEAFCAVWILENRYVSALRIEPYRDGYLVVGLESAPQHRQRGYAHVLLSAVVNYLKGKPIYSHIDKENAASLSVHYACGFHRILEYAVYADGSVLQSSCTMRFDK